MLKHPGLTHDRIRQYIQRELIDHVLTDEIPLETELLIKDCSGEAEARAAKGWKAIKKGESWGPAYQPGWYRVKGAVPAEWAGRCVVLTYGEAVVRWERHGMVEGTIWQEGQPTGGLDFGHQYFRLNDKAAGGEGIDLLVQTYAHNKETTVHAPEKPRTPEPEEYRGFLLACLDTELLDFAYDMEFALNHYEALPEGDLLKAQLLRAMNDAVNTAQGAGRKGILTAKKALKDALSALNGEISHEMTAVGHAHLDTAWLWPLRVTELKMIHTTAVQLSNMERYPDYVFVHSQASQYQWLKDQQPALLERIKKAIKKGQWEAVGSMWVEADCNLTGSEALVRQFLYGRRWFKQNLGVTTEDMWLPDVFGYSAAIPQILAKFGIDYFLTQKLSWNDTNKPPHHTFWWEGIDGSKVWVHFPPADTYCSDCSPKQMIDSVKAYKDHARCDQSLYLFGFGDGGGGPTEFHIERLKRARTAAGLPVFPKKARALDFFKAAKAASQDLCTWKGELYFEKHRGTYTTQAKNKKGNRETEFLMRDVEWLSLFAPGIPYPQEEIEKLWKLVLLNQFHDIIPGSSVKEVYEDSERDYSIIRKEGGDLVEAALKEIGSRLDSDGHAEPIALFHNVTLPGQGEIPWDKPEVPESLVVGDEVKPVQLVEAFGKKSLVFETPAAALGSVAVGGFSDRPAPGARLKAAGRKIENDQWVVKFDASGHITSITSLDDDPVEFIAPGAQANVFQIFEDTPLFWDAWDVDAFSFEKFVEIQKCESFEIVEKGPVRAAVEIVRKFGKSTIRQRISLGPTPGIRFDTWIDWQEDHRMLKVAFPVNVHSSRATYEIQWGNVERPTHKNTSWDVARFEVCCQKWFDLSEGGQGVALLNDGKYGCDTVDNVMRISLLRSPKAPDPTADRGEHCFSYVLLPHFDQVQHSQVVAAAYTLNAPLRHAWIKPSSGAASSTPMLAQVGDAAVRIETLKKAEDSDKVIARVYEAHSTRGRTELKLATPIKKAWLADMNEEPQQELEIEDGCVKFSFKPFEIITLLLEV